MAAKTDIGWTEMTWGVFLGCSFNSPGCHPLLRHVHGSVAQQTERFVV
jgi:protein gp37